MPASLRITYLKPINQRSHYILFSLYSHRIRCIRIRFALANSTLLEVSLFKISMRRGQDSKSCPKAFPRSLFARSEFRRSDSRHIPLLKATSNPMKDFDCLRRGQDSNLQGLTPAGSPNQCLAIRRTPPNYSLIPRKTFILSSTGGCVKNNLVNQLLDCFPLKGEEI